MQPTHLQKASALDFMIRKNTHIWMWHAGSGYLVAVFAKLVLPGGTVIGLEKVPELVSGCLHLYTNEWRAQLLSSIFASCLFYPSAFTSASSLCSHVFIPSLIKRSQCPQAQRSITSIQSARPELQAEQGKGWRIEHANALAGKTLFLDHLSMHYTEPERIDGHKDASSLAAACPYSQSSGHACVKLRTDVTSHEAPFHAIHVGAAADELPR